MSPRLPHPFRRRASRRGVALVIILAFIVLLTGLVVAYFSYCALQNEISQASVNQSAVGVFAHGALNTLIGDLRQEIAAGSDPVNDPEGDPVPGTWFPKSPETMRPGDQGFTRAYDTATGLENDGLNNLLKRSAAGAPFYAGTAYDTDARPPANRAAPVSTSTPSRNGRHLSPARWNAALLLPKATPESAKDLSPVAAFSVPDWIFVSRDGSNPTAWAEGLRWSPAGDATVVGRYAYAIYDEGGLLDVNAAGYPPGSPPERIGGKGSLAAADLTAIAGLTPEIVTALVGWRNHASARPGGTFPAYTFDAAARDGYFDFLTTNTWGFKRTANTALYQNRSDRMFTSRQQLIRFLTGALAGDETETAALQNALPYLGTFSRDLEAPSFRPDPDRPRNTTHQWASSTSTAVGYGGNDAYDPAGTLQDRINPPALAVRDGSGQPVLRRRFPLSRLALIKPDPSPEEAVKIKTFFGLEWDAATGGWVYDHGDPNQILKLSDIPAGREPDFFEILKAAIHCGSLGKQYGGTEGSFSLGGASIGSPHQFVANAAGIDGVINYQVIRIGANLIDQYDADSYPSAIAFGSPARMFYGVENLPYFAGWTQAWYHMRALSAADIDPGKLPPGDGANGFPYETWVMLQPILWNPHAPDAALDTDHTPTQFRVIAGSATGIATTVFPNVRPAWWQSGPVSRYPVPGGLTPQSWADAILDPQVSQLTFNATPNTAAGVAASFQEPYRLLYHYPAGSNADAAYPAGRIALNTSGAVVDTALAATDAPVDGNTVIGFFAGKCWSGPWQAIVTDPPPGSMPPNALTSGYLSTNNLQFTLQYQDAAGNWRTYDVIHQVYASSVQDSYMNTVDNSDTGTAVRAFLSSYRADPRTNRWGLFGIKTSALAPSPSGTTAPPGNGIHNAAVYPFIQGATLNPNAGINAGFVYRLGRNASGVPLVDWSTNQTLSDLMVNLHTGNSASYIPGRKFYYNDPDHVIRRADGGLMRSTTAANSNDALPMHTANHPSRPVVLNRPFRSVAEIGHTFSDTPWKNLNFFTPESGDAALLDAFCLHELETAPADLTVAGRVNLNTRQPQVLEAVIRGVSKAEGGPVTDEEARRAAEALVRWTTADPSDPANRSAGVFFKGPLRNRSELVGRFVSKVTYASPASSNTPNIGYDGSLSYQGYSSVLTSGSDGVFLPPASQPDNRDAAAIKRRRESVLRALADAGNTRTWNLFIDLVAQVGRFPPNAGALDEFAVDGEAHWWVHIAIDRFSGKVVARLVEPAPE